MNRYDDLPPVADVRLAAAILGVSPDTVYGLIHSGRLGHVKLGRCIRIPRHRLVEFLENSDAGPQADAATFATAAAERGGQHA